MLMFAYGLFAVYCVHAAKYLDRNTRVTKWFFLMWPVVMLGLSIPMLVEPAMSVLLGIPARLVEASPLAFYFSLRNGLASSQRTSILQM
jgi:hypothetical protein